MTAMPMTLTPQKRRDIDAAKAPLARAMSALRVWGAAVDCGSVFEGDQELMSSAQTALIGVRADLNDAIDNGCDAYPGLDDIVGRALVCILDDALWNHIAGETSTGPRAADLVATANLALIHLERVAAWLANPEASK